MATLCYWWAVILSAFSRHYYVQFHWIGIYLMIMFFCYGGTFVIQSLKGGWQKVLFERPCTDTCLPIIVIESIVFFSFFFFFLLFPFPKRFVCREDTRRFCTPMVTSWGLFNTFFFYAERLELRLRDEPNMCEDAVCY